LVSQVLTLYTTPVIYIFFDRLSKRFADFRSRHGAGHGEAETVPAD
jgi:multidrug efflux pump